ncbi:MAG: glycoside hydrolase family 38 C-terminal domain-containing protein [Bacteroidota bacterium]|nr:glycoside hydrolase family 38 C-terminal domain-containing protein [Bacteroidota bacterium]
MKRIFSNTRAIISILLLCMPVLSIASQKNKPKTVIPADTIHVIGHAHMDMNWLWTYSETMKMANDNLRQTVAFMDEFPDFTMLQSQASVYTFVEKVDPPLFDMVKKYVKTGRLELAGGMWTEGDMNLSSGEAISRTFLLGQRYFQSRFGKMANIGWLPDNFGHISQMPQILKQAGCDYFYFHRCKPYKGSFWWIGSDSSKVLCYANDGYNGDITPKLKDELQKITPDKHRLLQITGVGDHGGGPTRANIDMVHQLDKTPGYPTVKFTTAGDFFHKISNEMSGRPTHFGEMQFIFEGCYSNVSDIKEGNRNCENSLYSSEFFNTLRWLNGDKYPADELRDLWTTVTFNQFHDILPGSAINEANKEAVARYTEVLRKSTELRDNAFRKMADEVNFKTGMGQPIVAYNLQPTSRKVIVEANVYSHTEPVSIKANSWGNYYGSKNINPVDKGQGKVPTVLVRDGSGKTYPAQIVWAKVTPPGFTSKVQFIVDQFPAGGYKTFYVDVTKPGEYNDLIPFSNNTFETDFFRIKIDMKTGGIVSLIDKRSNSEYVKEGAQLNTLRIFMEDKKGGMKSWVLNKNVKIEDVTDIKSVKVVEDGPVRACIETVKIWGKSRFIERTYLYRSYPRIAYDMEVHWLETGNDSTDSPMLRAVFPLAMKDPRLYCHVPFDIVERPVDGKIGGQAVPESLNHRNDYGITAEGNDGQEVPAQKWVDVTDGKTGIALLNKTKYGHSVHNGELRLTLMRSAGNPDIYPNLGKFNISYALYPHAGDSNDQIWEEGDDFNVPVYAAEPPSMALVKNHATRPEEESFFSVFPSNVAMTGMKQSEDADELIIRLVEIEGKGTTATINLPVTAKSVRRLNLIEYPVENAATPEMQGKSIRVKLKPHEIVTLGIKK